MTMVDVDLLLQVALALAAHHGHAVERADYLDAARMLSSTVAPDIVALIG